MYQGSTTPVGVRCLKCGKTIIGVIHYIGPNPYCKDCIDAMQSSNQPTIPENHPYPSMGVGWTCPKCGVVNAPFVTQCPCSYNPYYITWKNPGTIPC